MEALPGSERLSPKATISLNCEAWAEMHVAADTAAARNRVPRRIVIFLRWF
jgi:hypothetical protein